MSKYYSSSIAFGAKQTKTERVVVSPTKIGDVTTDAVSGALTVDEVPTLDSLNPVSSDGVARAVIQAGAELPTRSSEDTGKVLTVKNSDGDLEWDTPEGGIPDMTGNDGKILGAVDNGGTMEAQWINKPVSNVTTTIGSFTVGVNGSGVPLSVDCTKGTITKQSTSFNYSAGGSTFSQTWFAALKFDLGENVTVDGGAFGNPLFVVPTTVSVTLPVGSSLVEGNSGLLFAQVYESGGQTFISNRGIPYSWASTSPITVTTVGDVSTVTLTAGSYEFVKAWNTHPSFDTLLFFLAFTGTLTSEAQTELENALSGCTVKNNQYGGGFATMTGYSIKPAELPDINSYQANKFLKVDGSGSYLQWANVPTELPTVTGNAGKVLTVNSGATGVEWATAQGGSSDVFIVEDSTTQGDVYTAYTSGKVLFYKASSGEMYYMSSNQFSTSSQLYLFGAYVGGYGTHATVVHFDAYINLANGAPVAPTSPFSSALGNIETIQTPSPLPTYSTTTDVGKALQVTSNGLAWINSVPIEVVSAMPASPTAGVLYIVTGA